MSIEDAGSIDGLGVSNVDGKVVLVISDHLDWVDERHHFDLLERKIGGYLGFIKSGQLLAAVPDSQDRDVRIELVHQFLPGETASLFLAAAERQLRTMGVELTYKELPEGY
jgi:hypothetical protein